MHVAAAGQARHLPLHAGRRQPRRFVRLQAAAGHATTARCVRSTTPARWPRRTTIVSQRVMKSLWKFRQHGQSGRWVSELFPQIARHVDDLCFLHGMHTEGVAHGPATLFLHSGSINLVRPSIGSWVLYGLGTENENLPGFVTHLPVDGQRRPAQLRQRLSAAGLPGHGHRPGRRPRHARRSIRNLGNAQRSPAEQRRQLDLLRALNAEQLQRIARRRRAGGRHRLVRAGLAHAGATRPACSTCRGETTETLRLYGIGEKDDRQLRPAMPDGPAAGRGRRALRAGQLRRQHAPTPPGTSTRTCPSTPTMPAPSTSRSPGCSPT